MTATKLAKILLEVDNSSVTAATELDRLLLRITHFPALLTALETVGNVNGKIELAFVGLPDQLIENVKRVIGPIDIEVFKYNKEAKHYVGFKFDITPLTEIEDIIPTKGSH